MYDAIAPTCEVAAAIATTTAHWGKAARAEIRPGRGSSSLRSPVASTCLWDREVETRLILHQCNEPSLALTALNGDGPAAFTWEGPSGAPFLSGP